MVKIAWKTINGYGPYAYLQESQKEQGKVKSKHLAYLGAAGTNGLVPGKMLTVEAVEDFPGGRVMVPTVGDDTLVALKPKPKAKVELMQDKVGEGLSKQQVMELLESQPKQKAAPKSPVLAPSPEPVKPLPPQVPLKVDQVALDAKGNPLITAENITGLEHEVAAGNLDTMVQLGHKLAARQPDPAKSWAIYYAVQDLWYKHASNQGTPFLVTIEVPPKGVAYPAKKDVNVDPKAGVSTTPTHLPSPAKTVAPESPATAPPVAPVANVPQVPLKVTNVALDANGKPLITDESIKKLEEAAAKGNMPGLRKVMYGLADMQKTEAEKWAINYATQDLVNKYNLNVGSFQVVTVNKPPDGVAYPKPEHVFSKSLDTETAPTPTTIHEIPGHVGPPPGITVAPKSATEAALAPSTPTDETPIQLDIIPNGGEEGLPLISTSNVKKLEKLANEGDIVNLSTTVLGLAQKQKTKSDQAAVKKAGQEFLDKLYAKQGKGKAKAEAVAPPPPAPTPPAPTPATVPQQSPLEVTEIAKDAKGQPLITAKSIKKLEEYAKKGDINQVVFAAHGLGDQQKTEAKKWAVFYAAQDLIHKINANKGNTEVSPIPPPPKGVAYPKPEDVASKPLEEKQVQFDKTSTGKVKGAPYFSLNAIQVLESAASMGDVDKLTHLLMGSANAQTDETIKLTIKKAGKDLLEKAYAHQGNPQKVNPDTLAVESKAATPEPPATAAASNEKQDLKSAPQPIIQGLPTPDPDDSPITLEIVPSVLKPSDVKKLEKLANEGNVLALVSATNTLKAKQLYKADQMAVAKAGQELLNQFYAKQSTAKPLSTDAPSDPGPVAPKSSISPAPPVGPAWVQVGPQAGSTPGGLFEDKDGVKHYIKCPPTLDHVNTELLAFDLYQAIGLNVPETDITVHDGKYCVTSKIIDGLSEGGTNPKDLKGTQEGFVADAWLANWDSVGVGTTKYDNILGLDGEAYRIDAGGALSYHGTGGEKGDKFGNEVTELDGMRDPKVNPVAATVYGDMTLDQIKASAELVLDLKPDEIETIVKLWQGNTPQSQAMIDKLLARQKYIGEWIGKKELGQKLISVLSEKANAKAPEDQPAAVTVAPNNVKVQVGDIPKDNKGKALVIPMNVKKLEAAAKKGQPELQKVCDELIAKMLSPAKKAAVQNVCADLKGQLQGIPMVEGDGGSGLSEAVAQVDAGTVKLPKQSTPSPKVVTKEVEAVKNESKDYNKDLEQVSGKKGSNEGGLFKDKKLDTLHYLKWPNGDVRAKIEGLTAMLYAYSDTPVPNIRVVDFQDKKAVMSDWIEDAQPMTVAQMKAHKDVLNGFVADAWLSNWDAVGLNADNIVKGPGNKAYRIDLGGSMLFRAQGKPKEFPAEVLELETMLDPSVNPQAASVFGAITADHLKEGATRLQNIDDTMIDQAVDHANLPKTSEDYPSSVYGEDAKDLPRFLKTRLKERRNHLVMEILKKAEAQEVAAADVAKTADLKKASITAIVGKTPGFKPSTPSAAAKWAVLNTVMGHELGGKTHAKEPSATLKDHYSSWKGYTGGPNGAALRWAAGELHGTGRQEISRLQKFHDFSVGKSKSKSKSKSTKSTDVQHVVNLSTTPHGKNLVDGIRVADKHNSAVFQLQHPSKKTLTLYRGWREDQLKYLSLNNSKVGDVLTLDDPPLYSWSLYPSIGKNFGHGGIVTKAQVPIENIVLSDVVNSTGHYSNENEVLFKGVDKVKMEVTHTT